MRTRSIGSFTVGEIGLGGMPMSIEGRPERARPAHGKTAAKRLH